MGGVSVQGDLCPGVGDLCPGIGGLRPGMEVSLSWSLSGTPPYGKERVVRILLECILLLSSFTLEINQIQ